MNILKKIYIFSLIGMAVCSAACEKILDKRYSRAISPDDVWNDEALVDAYVNNIYSDLMPGMAINTGPLSDESPDNGEMLPYLAGIATIDSYNWLPYGTIRKINIALENLEAGAIADGEKKKLSGQILFWRAWAYFGMVKAYGGVPLVLTSQDISDKEQLFVPRNKTSECITQIIKDLDDAISMLPEAWPGEEGRIDKGAAMAFKGRVLLYYASPQFTPAGNAARWQAAYDANKEALQLLSANGKGLYEDFGGIWQQELNKEVVMVRRYNNPGATHSQAGIRPINYSKDAANQDIPSLELVNAFPMKDGSVFNKATMSYDTLFRNRDDRFYATIGYNGSDLALKDMVEKGTFIWTYWLISGGSVVGPLGTPTSFYRNKGLDRTLTQQTAHAGAIDWPEIRFAEVLMNYGEAANELDKTSEALDVLFQIRNRAKILPGGDGRYGITAVSKEDIRTAYMKERFAEFAFEDKRWWDLRRWRRLDILNNIHRRTGLRYTLKNGETPPTGYDNINDVYSRFTYEVFDVDTRDMNLKDEYYFYGIPMYVLERNSDIQQTSGWNSGTFDPLE